MSRESDLTAMANTTYHPACVEAGSDPRGSLGVCIYVPASRHWLISYSPIHLA